MINNKIEEFLMKKGVKPTSNRLLVMKELLKATHPLSLANLECSLGYSMDKASIFRVLELFSEKNVVNVIEDGSRSFKYELFNEGANNAFGQHVHFYCEKCKEISCFESVRVPLINIPDGYYPRSVNYVIKGLCPKCLKR